jgi:DNA-binding HxlR family transcriptional regulator
MNDEKEMNDELEKIETKVIDDQETQIAVRRDIWSAIRKFANKDMAHIAQTLYNANFCGNHMTLGELEAETGIKKNNLNRELSEMKNVGIIIKEGRNYYLSNYGAALLEELENVKGRMRSIQKQAIDPYKQHSLTPASKIKSNFFAPSA